MIIILETAMGVNMDVQKNRDSEYMTALHKYEISLNI